MCSGASAYKETLNMRNSLLSRMSLVRLRKQMFKALRISEKTIKRALKSLRKHWLSLKQMKSH